MDGVDRFQKRKHEKFKQNKAKDGIGENQDNLEE